MLRIFEQYPRTAGARGSENAAERLPFLFFSRYGGNAAVEFLSATWLVQASAAAEKTSRARIGIASAIAAPTSHMVGNMIGVSSEAPHRR